MNAPVDFNVIEGMFRRQYKQIEVRFDPEHATAWTYLKPRARRASTSACSKSYAPTTAPSNPAAGASCTRGTCIRFTTTLVHPGSKAYSAWAETSRIWCC